MTQQDQEFIENSPAKIVETYKLDVDLHGMHSDAAGVKLQKMIRHYAESVAELRIKDLRK